MKVGDRFTLTNDALENYGEQWKDVVFQVTAWANRYVPSSNYFKNPEAYPHSHPEYDEGVAPMRLYDATPQNGEAWNTSVYQCEIKPV